MKWLCAFLSIAVLCVAQEEVPPEEIAALDPTFLTNDPLSADEFALPAPQVEIPQKSVFGTVALSSLFPGLGHVYLGDRRTAGELMGAACTTLGLLPFTSGNETSFSSNLTLFASISQYNTYAAYRDVRAYNQQTGYTYQMPREQFADLAWAPFSFSVLRKPEVWGGFLGIMALASIAGHIIDSQTAHIHLRTTIDWHPTPVIAFPIGIGEESFFRGYLQSELSEGLTPWGGLVFSSLVFGAAHIPNALLMEPEDRRNYYAFGIPLITTIGAYFGWVTQKNHSLKESVALHSWYDFLLFAATALVEKQTTASTTRPRSFAFSLPLSF